MTKIALFYGGKITKHLVLVRQAARDMGVDLQLISYNQVCFDTENGEIKIRTKSLEEGDWGDINGFDVVFFRTTGKHGEEVDLVVEGECGGQEASTVIDTTVKPWKILRQGLVKVKW